MELINKYKISVKKEIQGNSTKTFVDYHKVKKQNEFKASLMKDLIGEKQCLVVVDTNLAYIKKNVSMEDEADQLVELLDKYEINYRRVLTKSDDNYSVLGIPVKIGKPKQVTNYIIGFVILSEDIEKIENVIDKFNINLYIDLNNTGSDELLNTFSSTRGDMEELNGMFHYNIYNDSFFCRSRISSDEEKTKFVDEVLQKYLKSMKG